MQIVLNGTITAADQSTVSSAIMSYIQSAMVIRSDLVRIHIDTMGRRNGAGRGERRRLQSGIMTRITIALQPSSQLQYKHCGGSICDTSLKICHPCPHAYVLLEEDLGANQALHDRMRLYTTIATAVNQSHSQESYTLGILSTSTTIEHVAYEAPSPPPPRPPPFPPPPPPPAFPPSHPLHYPLWYRLLADPFALFFIVVACLVAAFCTTVAVVEDSDGSKPVTSKPWWQQAFTNFSDGSRSLLTSSVGLPGPSALLPPRPRPSALPPRPKLPGLSMRDRDALFMA